MTVASVLRRNIFILSFLYSLQYGLIIFLNSSYLDELGFTDQGVGMISALGYAVALALMLLVPFALRMFGDRHLLVMGFVAAGALFFAVAVSTIPLVSALLLSAAIGLSVSLYVLIDIFLATVSGDIHKTGGRRGMYVTLVNGGLAAAQILLIVLLANGAFSFVYLVGSLMLFALAIISGRLLREFQDAEYERPDWPAVFRKVSASKDLQSIFCVQFLLQIFYSVMVVYVPLYLHEYIGMPLEHMAIVFAVMLIPFLVLEIPVGRLEDSAWGEQEVLLTGFVLSAIAVAALALITATSVWVWALALFGTRVGAALLDIGSEAYFFKHVHGGDSGEVSAYRMLRPIAYIIGPLLGVLFLFAFPLQYLFIALGVVMLLGLLPSLWLKDTR